MNRKIQHDFPLFFFFFHCKILKHFESTQTNIYPTESALIEVSSFTGNYMMWIEEEATKQYILCFIPLFIYRIITGAGSCVL